MTVNVLDLSFHTETGRPSLALMATLGERHGNRIERLAEPSDLRRWIELCGVAESPPECNDDDLDLAKQLRACLISVIESLFSKSEPANEDIDAINRFARSETGSRQLAPDGRSLKPSKPLSIENLLGMVARDAIDLVTGDEFERVKLCAAEDCSVFFVDRSRPGKRRWCSMSRCGNRSKKKSFRERAGH